MEPIFEFISNTTDGVFAVDGEQRIVLWNDGAKALLGYPPEEVLGRRCFEVIAGTDAHGCAVCEPNCQAMCLVRRSKRVSSADVRTTTRDDLNVWINVSTILVPSMWQDLSVLVHLFRDVSRSKEIERVARYLVTLLRANQPAPPQPTATSAEPKLDALTEREREVLQLLATGASTERIAEKLFICSTTVRNHIQSVLSKLGVHSRLEAVALSLKNGPL